ncbi:hypothetical protein Tco_0496869 [Tanacetum coccineum]
MWRISRNANTNHSTTENGTARPEEMQKLQLNGYSELLRIMNLGVSPINYVAAVVGDDLWYDDDDDGGGVMVAAVGRQLEGVEARGGEWIWGSGRSGHEDSIWFRPECSLENFSGGGGGYHMVAGGGGVVGRVAEKYGRRWR